MFGRKNRMPKPEPAPAGPAPAPPNEICFLCGGLLGTGEGVLVNENPRMAAHKDRPASCIHALREQLINLRARVERLEG